MLLIIDEKFQKLFKGELDIHLLKTHKSIHIKKKKKESGSWQKQQLCSHPFARHTAIHVTHIGVCIYNVYILPIYVYVHGFCFPLHRWSNLLQCWLVPCINIWIVLHFLLHLYLVELPLPLFSPVRMCCVGLCEKWTDFTPFSRRWEEACIRSLFRDQVTFLALEITPWLRGWVNSTLSLFAIIEY